MGVVWNRTKNHRRRIDYSPTDIYCLKNYGVVQCNFTTGKTLMKIMIVTDDWYPQRDIFVNVEKQLILKGFEPVIISPSLFKTFSLPFDDEIRIPRNLTQRKIDDIFKLHDPLFVHIATEGPIGLKFRKYCLKHKIKFTSSIHHTSTILPTSWKNWFIRYFHAVSNNILTTHGIEHDLRNRGFEKLVIWESGVDTDLFNPDKRKSDNDEPVWLYVGDISTKENIQDFLDLEVCGSKRLVGNGPDLLKLMEKYSGRKDIVFVGAMLPSAVAKEYANADVTVFPNSANSPTCSIIESMATGTPVAGFNIPGPGNVILNHINGCTSEDLKDACEKALYCSRETVHSTTKIMYNWSTITDIFVSSLVPCKN